MTNWIYRTIVVPDSQVEFARQLTATVAGSAGEGMYTTPLASTEEPTVTTHWISAGLISEEFALMLPLMQFTEEGWVVVSEGNPEMVAEVSTTNGFEVTTEQVQELFSTSCVSEQDAFACMPVLGLVMKTESQESEQQD
jgi:hypothetical protein